MKESQLKMSSSIYSMFCFFKLLKHVTQELPKITIQEANEDNCVSCEFPESDLQQYHKIYLFLQMKNCELIFQQIYDSVKEDYKDDKLYQFFVSFFEVECEKFLTVSFDVSALDENSFDVNNPYNPFVSVINATTLLTKNFELKRNEITLTITSDNQFAILGTFQGDNQVTFSQEENQIIMSNLIAYIHEFDDIKNMTYLYDLLGEISLGAKFTEYELSLFFKIKEALKEKVDILIKKNTKLHQGCQDEIFQHLTSKTIQ